MYDVSIPCAGRPLQVVSAPALQRQRSRHCLASFCRWASQVHGSPALHTHMAGSQRKCTTACSIARGHMGTVCAVHSARHALRCLNGGSCLSHAGKSHVRSAWEPGVTRYERAKCTAPRPVLPVAFHYYGRCLLVAFRHAGLWTAGTRSALLPSHEMLKVKHP